MPTKKTTATKAETKTTTVKKAATKTTTKAAAVKKDTKTTEKKTVAKKAEVKKAPAKKVTATKKVEEKKVEEAPKKTTVVKKTTAKKVEATKAPAKKTVAKKTTTKKTTTTKKAEAAPTTTTKKVEEKKVEAPAKKAAVKKAPTKKTVAKKATTAKKTTTRKPSAKKVKEEKLAQYNSFAIDTCLEMARAMGVDLAYDGYASMLLDSDDVKVLSKQVLDQYNVDAKAFTFEKDGYDTDLIEVIFNRIAETVDIKASDFKNIEKEVKVHAKYTIKDDATVNNEEYQKDFDLVREVLMIGQRKDVHSTDDMKVFIKVDPTDLIEKFMDLAYHVLPLFEYDDVKYYENFIYTVLSQFENLHQKWGTRALMDVADLYIKHGDYGLGDADYNYVLRENDIKDMIYYRFANIYADIDLDKAKAIANSSFQFVDDRYDYYPKIIEILEK